MSQTIHKNIRIIRTKDDNGSYFVVQRGYQGVKGWKMFMETRFTIENNMDADTPAAYERAVKATCDQAEAFAEKLRQQLDAVASDSTPPVTSEADLQVIESKLDDMLDFFGKIDAVPDDLVDQFFSISNKIDDIQSLLARLLLKKVGC